ncbi:MAG TPA: rRNA maturation RNase YbeY [Burkholderiales bacterium]|nr:rRNA maturation RNase YbeY [Burkholderiales bacterium]
MKTKSAGSKPRLSFTVQYAAASRNLPSRAQLRKWAHAALEREARITVRIVGQAEGKALNRNFRGKDYATNVLTFVFRDTPPFEGDLALCAPVIAREARDQGKSIVAHYAHMVVHGVLHLQGYDHENDADARIMEKRESQIIAGLSYPDPYDAKHEG